tara:strand:+ start:2805 stop:3455 length:651 start_codon:yes stop_codon:yes gene_type:complete
MTSSPKEVLQVARRIADYAVEEGALLGGRSQRYTYEHLGAALADSVLQAGLNYMNVVRPRVLAIFQTHPDHKTISSLTELIQRGGTGAFLNWSHHEKLSRFEHLVIFLERRDIEYIQDLRAGLESNEFCRAMQTVKGIGPKTVDYMACLVGIDSIAVDRHVRKFASSVGIARSDYTFLQSSFCCAADLLSLSRREFDAWLWNRAVSQTPEQLDLVV